MKSAAINELALQYKMYLINFFFRKIKCFSLVVTIEVGLKDQVHSEMTLISNDLNGLQSCWKILFEAAQARIFLLDDLREFFLRFRVGGTKKINKKALKMTS